VRSILASPVLTDRSRALVLGGRAVPCAQLPPGGGLPATAATGREPEQREDDRADAGDCPATTGEDSRADARLS
jgi:hypothetical protein